VVGGSTQQDGFSSRDSRAVVWHGNNWQDKTPLGTLKSDNTGTSYVYALNGDGSIAAGWAESDTSTRRATIWSGTNWADKADLGTLKSDNSGISWVTGLSTDGHTAAGYAQDDNGNTRATVWRSSNWNDNSLLQKQDLGTLKADNSGNATVQVISGDGRIAAGASDSDSGYRRAVVWFIGRGRAVDIDNTHRSISTLSADTFSLLAARGNAVKSLLDGCRAEKGRYCYTAGYGYHNTTHDTRSHAAEFSLGYGFTDNFDAGFSLSVPAAHGRSGSYRLKTGMGLGLSARLRSTDGRWYVTPAVAFDSYKANVHRPHFNGTEETNNGARVKGRAYSLTLGQNFGTPESKSFGWYAALRRTEAKRTAYQEAESLSFPFAYGEARLKDTALAVGTEGSLQLTDKLAWQGGLEVEQRLGGSETRFTASANHLGDYAEAHKPTGFRPNIQTALTYAFSPEAKLSLGGYLGRSAFTGTDKGVYLKLHGKF
jgi:autotransporter beta-domain protein